MSSLHVSWDAVQHAGRAARARRLRVRLRSSTRSSASRAAACASATCCRASTSMPLAILSTHSYAAEGGTIRGELVIAEHMTMTLAAARRSRAAGRRHGRLRPHARGGARRRCRSASRTSRALQDRGALVEGVLGVQAGLLRRVPADNPWIHQPFEVYDTLRPGRTARRGSGADARCDGPNATQRNAASIPTRLLLTRPGDRCAGSQALASTRCRGRSAVRSDERQAGPDDRLRGNDDEAHSDRCRGTLRRSRRSPAAQAQDGDHADLDPDRAVGGVLRTGRAARHPDARRRQALARLRQCAGRRQRPPDRAEVARRQVRVEARRREHQEADRAGPRLPALRLRRHADERRRRCRSSPRRACRSSRRSPAPSSCARRSTATSSTSARATTTRPRRSSTT